MDFNEELIALMQTKIQYYTELKNAEDENQSYEMRQRLLQHNDTMDAYHKLVESYSAFDSKKIGKALANLITEFEDTKYVYQEALCYRYSTTYHVRIIIAEENKCPYYYGDLISALVRGKAIVLESCSIDPNSSLSWHSIGTQIPFYRANITTHFLDTCVRYDNFYYVKDFIDELISYKMEHDLKDISSEELRELLIRFILSRIDQSERRNKNRLLTQQQEALRPKAGEFERDHELFMEREFGFSSLSDSPVRIMTLPSFSWERYYEGKYD